MEEQLPCTSETIQPQIIHSKDSPQDDKTQQESIRYQRTISKQKKKVKKITKDIRCKKKRFQTNIILKHAQKDINGLNIEKTTENSLILYKDRNQIHEESHIFRPIVLSSVFFIAGDIIIEPRDTLNGEERIRHIDIFNNFRNITSVESCKNFLQFTMESVKPLLNLEEIIYCLENSQDASNYEYAQSLRRYQPAVFLVEDLINKVINQYNQNPSDLEELLKKREAFVIEQQNKLLEELGNQGAFASVCLLSLSFRNKTIQSTHLSFTKKSIGFLGADFNSMLTYLLRQGFINFLNHQSRRMVFSSTIDHFADFKQILQYTLPSFEILTADGIRFTCDCDVSYKSVEFPEELQFNGDEVKKLNNIESINVMKFTITPKIVRSVLEIREATPSNFADKIELFCFEYAMRSSILLDKYYPDLSKHPNRFIKNDSKQTQCGYRRIHNPDSQLKQATQE